MIKLKRKCRKLKQQNIFPELTIHRISPYCFQNNTDLLTHVRGFIYGQLWVLCSWTVPRTLISLYFLWSSLWNILKYIFFVWKIMHPPVVLVQKHFQLLCSVLRYDSERDSMLHILLFSPFHSLRRCVFPPHGMAYAYMLSDTIFLPANIILLQSLPSSPLCRLTQPK